MPSTQTAVKMPNRWRVEPAGVQRTGACGPAQTSSAPFEQGVLYEETTPQRAVSKTGWLPVGTIPFNAPPVERGVLYDD
jgi:hypothetical protein